MRFRDVRFRILLPAASLLLGVFLFHLGDSQVRHVAVGGHGFEHPPQDSVALAKYVHYAINAPAWALLPDTREMRWAPSTYLTGYELRYFLAVVALWFSIGLVLDWRVMGRDSRFNLGRRLRSVLGAIAVLFGLFICLSVIGLPPHYLPWKDYLMSILKTVLNGGYGWWFFVAGMIWGVAFVAVGLYAFNTAGQVNAD